MVKTQGELEEGVRSDMEALADPEKSEHHAKAQAAEIEGRQRKRDELLGIRDGELLRQAGPVDEAIDEMEDGETWSRAHVFNIVPDPEEPGSAPYAKVYLDGIELRGLVSVQQIRRAGQVNRIVLEMFANFGPEVAPEDSRGADVGD